jgi:hypothetical protein
LNSLGGATLLSPFDSGSVMPFDELFGPTPTTEGISDFGESSYKKKFVWVNLFLIFPP